MDEKKWKNNEQKQKRNEQEKVIKINVKIHVLNNNKNIKESVCLIFLKIVQYFELYYKPI